MIDTLLIQKDLSDTERLMFQSEFSSVRKSATTGVLLAVLLGGIGGHHFYLGKIGWGLIYLLFSWTFIPLVIGLVECFMMSERIKRYNDEKAFEIVTKIKMIRDAGK